MEAFKKLVDMKFFLPDAKQLDWRQALPYLYRGKAGMILCGNFIVGQIPPNIRDNIGFIPFPLIDKDTAPSEDAPTDVFAISKDSKNIDMAKKFLAYVAQKKVQEKLNNGLLMISPHKDAKASNDYYIQEGSKLLNKAEHVTQFYDRDTRPEMAKEAVVIIANFLEKSDIVSTLKALEEIRLKVYK